MKVPGIEEMARTFSDGYRAAPWASQERLFEAGLLAVFETHVGPMLAATWLRCITKIEGKVEG